MADFWQQAQWAYQHELKADEEDDRPWSPLGHCTPLRDMVEDLEGPIEKGNIEEARGCLTGIAGYCRLIADSLTQWQYHNGVWSIDLWGDWSVEILFSTGDSVVFEWDLVDIATFDIYRIGEDGRRAFQERVKGTKGGAFVLSRALNDYIKIEIKEPPVPDSNPNCGGSNGQIRDSYQEKRPGAPVQSQCGSQVAAGRYKPSAAAT